MKHTEDARETFIRAWASLASLFSFSPSTGRVCALLISTSEPLCLGDIADRLGLSRGNVSMCLKELRAWGVVQRVPRAGDRREFYESRGDLFEQTLAIARERKRREFDPVLGDALDALASLTEHASDGEAEKLRGIADYLTTIDRVGRDVLGNEHAAHALIALLKSGFGIAPAADPTSTGGTER